MVGRIYLLYAEFNLSLNWGRTLVSFIPTVTTTGLSKFVKITFEDTTGTSEEEQRFEVQKGWDDLAGLKRDVLGVLGTILKELPDEPEAITEPTRHQLAFPEQAYAIKIFLWATGGPMFYSSSAVLMGSLASALLVGALASAALQADSVEQYHAIFELQLEVGNDKAAGSLTIEQSSPLLPEIGLRMQQDRYRLISADGDTRTEDGRLYWELPEGRSELRYEVVLTQARGKGFDGLVTEDWAIFRGDDMFPTTRVDDAVTAVSRSSLRLLLPEGWTAVAPYRGSDVDGWRVDKPDYRFDRPTGWILAGRLGVKRENIADVAITIAAPIGARAQRVSMLALLRWNLPWFVEQAPAVPSHLLIVSGPDPLWRGGLSAPNSLFIHADLPLISEDGSSPLMHEVAHVLFPVDAADDEDWIDEGLAEYLSLKALRSSGTLSEQRYQRSIRHFRERGERASSLYSADSKGDVTARAVAMLDDLDQELRAASDGEADMMELTRRMMASPEPLTMARIRELAAQLIGREPRSLSPDMVAWQTPGPGRQTGLDK